MQIEKWKLRRKSWLVKLLMKKYGLSVEHLAKILNTSVAYVNSKLARNSFSFEDILAIADASGYYLIFHDKDETGNEIIFNFEEWFEDTDPEIIARVKSVSEERKAVKEVQQLYLQKKAELEEMKVKYGFKD